MFTEQEAHQQSQHITADLELLILSFFILEPFQPHGLASF